jgi:hypothetical protein
VRRGLLVGRSRAPVERGNDVGKARLKISANPEAAEASFGQYDPDGVAVEYEVV